MAHQERARALGGLVSTGRRERVALPAAAGTELSSPPYERDAALEPSFEPRSIGAEIASQLLQIAQAYKQLREQQRIQAETQARVTEGQKRVAGGDRGTREPPVSSTTQHRPGRGGRNAAAEPQSFGLLLASLPGHFFTYMPSRDSGRSSLHPWLTSFDPPGRKALEPNFV